MNHSEISKIREQFTSGLWPKFLDSIQITGLRGWTGQNVVFKFPLSIIVGENGTGKSTVLKAAACSYENVHGKKSFYASDFFIQTTWDKIKNVTIKYAVIEGSQRREYQITKITSRWNNPDRSKRDVFFMDINRTVPLDATVGYAKIAKLAREELTNDKLEDETKSELSLILGREYIDASFVGTNIDINRKVGILTRSDQKVISQFHQGAGEDSILDMMNIFQSVPKYSLVIIDEIENSLHPSSQRQLIKYLLKLCRINKLQIIASTHSPTTLEELPKEGIILLENTNNSINIIHGVSPQYVFNKIDSDKHPELYIFVEDEESEILLNNVIRLHTKKGAEIIKRVCFLQVGSADVVKTLCMTAQKNKLPNKSIGFVDGDKREDYKDIIGVYYLPGNEAPEKIIYNDLKKINWEGLNERFAVGAGDLHEYFEKAMLEEHHKWNSQVGDKILKSKTIVWEIITDQWCKKCLSEECKEDIIQSILEHLGEN